MISFLIKNQKQTLSQLNQQGSCLSAMPHFGIQSGSEQGFEIL